MPGRKLLLRSNWPCSSSPRPTLLEPLTMSTMYLGFASRLEGRLGPPGVVADPDHAVLGRGLVLVRAGADAVGVGVLEDVLVGLRFPDVLGQDGAVVGPGRELLVGRVLELHDDGRRVGRGRVADEVPEVGADGRDLGQADGEGDVVGRDRLAVGPRHAGADLDRVGRRVRPVAALSEPGLELVGQRVVQEQRLVLEADDAHRGVRDRAGSRSTADPTACRSCRASRRADTR